MRYPSPAERSRAAIRAAVVACVASLAFRMATGTPAGAAQEAIAASRGSPDPDGAIPYQFHAASAGTWALWGAPTSPRAGPRPAPLSPVFRRFGCGLQMGG